MNQNLMFMYTENIKKIYLIGFDTIKDGFWVRPSIV